MERHGWWPLTVVIIICMITFAAMVIRYNDGEAQKYLATVEGGGTVLCTNIKTGERIVSYP